MSRIWIYCALALLLGRSLDAQPERAPNLGQLGRMAREYYSDHLAPGHPESNGGGDHPDAMRGIPLPSPGPGLNFGFSVSMAGDVNGDGYADVIVGAPNYVAQTGRAYIFFGGPVMDNIPDVILTGEATSNFFGYSVSAAGDVNGDGFADVIVGATNYGGGTGRAYVFFGGPVMDNIPDVIMTGETTDSNFGWSVSTAGDVNGDGYADVVVGAEGYVANTGRAYVFFGGPTMNNVPDVVMTGEATGNFFGYSVSTAGDVNSDGYSDVVVGAEGYSANTGRAYVFFGGSGMNNVPDVVLTGEAASEFFGCSVSTAGDVNGDGYADLVVGAEGYSGNIGRAYVFFGGSPMNNVPDVVMTGEGTNSLFGASVSGAGDVNGDGYSDVVVGAYGYSTNTGRVYMYFGGPGMDNTADVVLTGEGTANYFGFSVSPAGDVNGGGYADVIVGARGYSGSTGRAYLYFNALTGPDLPDYELTGSPAIEGFGTVVANAGDANGDGYPDVIVGAPDYSSSTGRAYIFFGGPIMDNVPDVILTGEAVNSDFGQSVSTAGDVNGDGYADVIVGARGYSSNTGRAYIFFGGPIMDGAPDVILTGEAANNSFGQSVSAAGDVNGDGYADVIVSAGGYSNNTGRVYIFFGGSTMNNVPDVILTGTAAGNGFGISVSTAGDVNGDGYADVIVGEFAYSNATGRAYVYFGGASMDNLADVVLTGEGTFNYFGVSVSTAGDVNGDGYADVIVGADEYGGNIGRAYVFFGGPLMDSVPDVVMTGEGRGVFGYSVSGAGDVNGDGYADVIVGDYVNSNYAGRAYIFFGGASMDNTPDVIMTGETTTSTFGISVSSAGDVNRDGYSDVLVGASGYSPFGRAYVDLSSPPPIIPRITSIRDVPFDQGGHVVLAWRRSAYDVRNVARVTGYRVERSYPPNGNGFQWEAIATVTAIQNPLYSYTASTPYDSVSGTNGTFYFRITAVTSNVNEYWRSNIMSGHSVDNLAPGVPLSAGIRAVDTSTVRLSWRPPGDQDLGGFVVYRSSVGGFTPSDSTRFASVSDTVLSDPSAGSHLSCFYRITARDIHGNESTPSPELARTSLPVLSGWDLVSVPLTVSDYTATTLYPGAASQAFWFQGSYVPQSVLANGRGYWVFYTSGQTVEQAGTRLPGETIPVVTGWNMIGTIASPVATGSIIQSPPGIVASSYYGFAGSYVNVTTLEPGNGYWVYVTAPGTLGLTSSTGPLAKEEPTLLDSLNRLLITDATGHKQELYFGKGGEERSLFYRLPPRGPDGTADIRFATNSMVAVADTPTTVGIQMNAVHYPVQIRWTIKSPEPGALIVHGQETALHGEGVVSIESESPLALSLSATQGTSNKPATFALEQNYPNPFNPSTIIHYALPVASQVTLKVYNALGQEVATLVNQQQNAGFQSISWNAAGVASGVYFYRLSTSNFVQTRKLVFLR